MIDNTICLPKNQFTKGLSSPRWLQASRNTKMQEKKHQLTDFATSQAIHIYDYIIK